jgi:preprotein translocase subunit SecB
MAEVKDSSNNEFGVITDISEATKPNPASEQKSELGIRQIFLKDLSYEAPGLMEALNGNWKPEVGLDLQTKASKVADDTYEVVLKITTTVKNAGKTAFLVEIEHAGIFVLKNFPAPQLNYMLGSYCPNILFPYAREVISEMVMKGGFPPLYLAPVNFDALYEQHAAKQQK